ncbi:MAG TPA: NUDIX hydrolase [Holophaga sp.]|jgi:8-oxo-dGTP pyrophosphatase MutT (NUDIX family)|nr:NUDIX hydrolase [Holophaga sp.]
MRLLAEHSPGFDPSLPWSEESEILRGQSLLFDQVGALRRSPFTGRRHEFTRLRCPEWVNVIAFLPVQEGGELLTVEQFRHGIDAPTLEIVGGVCDPGEDPADSARRELQEETGHVSDQWISLGSCAPNPAVQDNHCHFFLALDCRSIGALELDPSEELRVWALSWQEWESRMKSGEISHALVLAAFMRLFCWEGWPALRASLEGSSSH